MLSFIGNPNFALNNKIFEEKLEDIDTKIEEKIEELGKSSNDIILTTEKTLIDSKEGGLKLISIEGNTVQSTDPLPTPDAPQEINSVVVSEIKGVGKNLLKIKTLPENSVTHGITFTPNGYGGIKLNGTAEQNFDLSIVGYYGYSDTDLQTFGQKVIVSKTGIDGVEIHVGKGIINYTSSTATKDLVIDTTEKPISWIVLRVVKGTTLNNVTVYPMIRPADIEDDTYEPYTEKKITLSAPITLRGIGDVKDVLCKRDGVYGVLRKIGKWIITGSESWAKSNSRKGAFYITPSKIGEAAGFGTAKLSAECFCSHLTYVDISIYTVGHCSFDPVDNTYSFWFTNEDRTLDSFKTWLASNNVTVDYQLATPTFEPLPLADQIALHTLETFDAVTHLLTDSEIEPVIEVEYGTSKVGAYAIKGMNDVEADKILSKINISDTALNRQTLGYTKKNLLKNTATAQTINGITFTINDDKSVTVNGTATTTIWFNIMNEKPILKGNYILSGCPSGGSEETYYFYAYDLVKGVNLGRDYGDGVKINLTDTIQRAKITFSIISGTTVDNLTVYPMIRSADITDDTYEPYVDDVDTRLNNNNANINTINNNINTINANINTINNNINTINANINTINTKFNNQVGTLKFSVNANGILEVTY